MSSTVLPVCGVALLLGISCWSIGGVIVSSPAPLVRLLGGWCVFLGVCMVPWITGLSAHAARPLLWAFFAAGIILAGRQRRWADLAAALACTTIIGALLLSPFFHLSGLLTYGVHGTDMWGYVITAEWLQDHSLRQFPEIGVSAMRFNWTWHVLAIRERPLVYESLACLGAATGLGPAQAYLAYPITLLATLAMGLAREPGIFRLKFWPLVVAPAVVLVFHPLVILPWVAGFFAGSIVGLFTAHAFASAARSGTETERREALVLAVLMLVFCAGLYSLKFLWVALALGGVPALATTAAALWRRDLSGLARLRSDRWLMGALAAIIVLVAALLLLGRDQEANTGKPQLPVAAAGHALGEFGGASPYVWLGYDPGSASDRNPLRNPIGLAALVITTTLFVLVCWARWRAGRDFRIPLLLALLAGLVLKTAGDELLMAKTLTVVGLAGLVMLAVVSVELRHTWLGILAAVICCLPAVRSAAEMQDVIYRPYIWCTEDNLPDIKDGQDWRILGYLFYREDRDGYAWAKNPRIFYSITQFLPPPMRQRLAEKYHVPKDP